TSTLRSPIAMTLSGDGQHLYLASSVNPLSDGQAQIFRLLTNNGAPSIDPAGPITVSYPHGAELPGCVAPDHSPTNCGIYSGISAILERTGTLYAFGFTLPRYAPDKSYSDPEFGETTGSITAMAGLVKYDLTTNQQTQTALA